MKYLFVVVAIFVFIIICYLQFFPSSNSFVLETSTNNRVKSSARNPMVPKYAQKIPFILHQTSRSSEVELQQYETCMINRYMNPEYKYQFYTDQEIQQYVRTHYPQYVKAFDSLIPGAFRADLFRYMVLLREGGVYMDCKTSTIIPLREFLPSNTGFASFTDFDESAVQISFVASVPGHPIVQRALELAIANISEHKYGRNALDVTGPQVCGRVINQLIGKSEYDTLETREYPEIDASILGRLKVYRNHGYEVLVNGNDQPLVARACGSYYDNRSSWDSVFDFNSYGRRWKTSRIYKHK